MIPQWCQNYVGIPFKNHGRDARGCDCWGLVRLVLARQFNITVSSFTAAYKTALDGAAISRLCEQEKMAWLKVAPPQPADLVLLIVRGRPWHIGLVVQPPWMLHVERGADTVLERYNNLTWQNKIEGFYRHHAA